MSNLSIKPVRDLQKSIVSTHTQVEKQETKIVKDIFLFVKKYSDPQIHTWLAAEKISTTKKANDYTGVTKMAFAKLGVDNVSDQRINFYSTVCLAIEQAGVEERDLEEYLNDKTLSKIRNDYLEAKRTDNNENEADSFLKERRTFKNSFKNSELKKNALQLVVGYTDDTGNFISNYIVDDETQAQKFVKLAIKPPTPEKNPFLPLLTLLRGVKNPFKKIKNVRFKFVRSETDVTVEMYDGDGHSNEVISIESTEGLASCVPKGTSELSLLKHKAINRLKNMCKHDKDADWKLSGKNITITIRGKTVSELLDIIKENAKSGKANYPDVDKQDERKLVVMFE